MNVTLKWIKIVCLEENVTPDSTFQYFGHYSVCISVSAENGERKI